MTIINEDRLLGDTVMSLPAIKMLSETSKSEPAYLFMANGDTKQLVPKTWNVDKPRWSATQDTIYRVREYDLHASGLSKQVHPTVGFCRQAGFDVTEPIKPEIFFTERSWQPKYDYVLSVHSAMDGGRQWQMDEWQKLVNKLRDEGSVCVVGQAKYGKPLEGVDYYYDQPINDVCGVLSKAGTVITIDNGISRLKHAVGGKHIILLSTVIPKVWGSYPGAHVIYDEPSRFGVDQVYNLCKSL